jgi:regulator of replication initiation timing
MGYQAMAKTATRSIELEPIDRLEEKLKRLVSMVERMQGEQAHAAEENQRLGRELDAMRSRLATNDSLSNELSALK